MDKSLIQIFRGDDTDGLGYQSIQGKITTTLDLTGCRAVFRYLGFTQEFDPIPENGRITITMPASATSKFPPGLGYASLRVYDSEGKVRTFTNRIPVFVTVYAPSECGGEFEVVFNGGNLELEPLKIKSVNGYRIYDGYLEQIIDKATAIEYGLALLFDSGDSAKDTNSGYAATPKAVQAAYDAIIQELTDNYYNAEETEEAIDRIAAYYITSDAQGNPFATYAALAGATAFYSGGQLRMPTRNDYCVVSADETHEGEQYRYIYSVNQQGVGQWEAQYAVGGSIELDNTVTRTSGNGVKSSGIWSAIWGALTALPGVSSLYDWVVAQLAGKASAASVAPLFFARYYPDGSVKSVSEFTAGIKYDAPDTTNRTITVKPFCRTDTATDNSYLVGRVVIPPFVDAQGNGYVSDDGTRYKVVGVSDGRVVDDNSNLTAVIAPNTVTNIGEYAFCYCNSLTSVSFPAVTNIREYAFSGTSLSSVSLSDATTVGSDAFSGCALLTSVSLPAAKTVGSDAFMDCGSLTSVLLPSVTNIMDYAFKRCFRLTSGSFPAATTIGEYAFSECISMTSVSLPSATSIGIEAFYDCVALTSADFGGTPRSSVPTLGTDAFSGVPASCKIIVPYMQYDAWIAANGWSDLPQEFVRHAEKADKPATFTTGNLAALDANGNPVDSGIAKTAVAPLASPAFTGTPTAPTPTAGDNSTKVATTAFVKTAVAGVTPNLDYVMRVDPETGGIYYTTPDTNA